MSDKEKKLDMSETLLLGILDNHKGVDLAVPASRLAELVDLDSRKLRGTINHLVIEHYILIGSAAGRGGGYYLITTAQEAKAFYRAFRHRAMTALLRASRILKLAPLEGAVQLTLDSVMAGDKIPGTGAALNKILEAYKKDPKRYAEEIAELKGHPLLMDSERMARINKKARELAELTGPGPVPSGN